METSLQSVAQGETEPARGRSSYKEIWGVVDRNGRGYWTRLGVAFPGKNDSWKLRFDYMPVNAEARIHMLEPRALIWVQPSGGTPSSKPNRSPKPAGPESPPEGIPTTQIMMMKVATGMTAAGVRWIRWFTINPSHTVSPERAG